MEGTPVTRNPRLCMVVHGPYPLAEPRVEQEALTAVASGWEVDVVALRLPGEPARETRDGIDVIRLPLTHRRGGGMRVLGEYIGFALLATLAVARLHLTRRYAVVQVHAPPEFLVVAALLPRLLGARVILDVHDRGSDMFTMRFGRAPAALLRVEKAAASAADAVVTVHNPYARALEASGVPLEKLTVVMNAPRDALLPEAPAEGRDGFVVAYHGTITPAYGLELLVEAAALTVGAVPDLALQIVGEGDGAEAVRRRARELGIDGRMRLEGRYLPRPEAIARVAGASVGVIPNPPMRLNDFALPSKLFEYVAIGVPVAAPDLLTLREHFSEDELFFYRAGNAESLAETLRAIAADPDAATAKAGAARSRFRAEYGWERSAERYRALLERLAGA